MKLLAAVLILNFAFTSMAQSIDFCQALTVNNKSIDYIFQFDYIDGTDYMINNFIVIADNYWLIDVTNFDNYYLNSTMGSNSRVFDSQYMMAFTVLKTLKYKGQIQDILRYGFMKKNDFTIDWKNLTKSKNRNDFDYFTSDSSDVKGNSTQDDHKLEPTAGSPNLVTFKVGESGPSYVNKSKDGDYTTIQYNQVLSQEPISSEEASFQRNYTEIQMSFMTPSSYTPVFWNVKASNRTADYPTWTSTSVGSDQIVGVLGAFYYDLFPNNLTFIVFYSANNAIEYCTMVMDRIINQTVDEKCYSRRKTLIHCPDAAEGSGLTIWMILLITAFIWIPLIIFILFICFICLRRCARKNSEPFQADSTMRSLNNATVKTINSDTGEIVPSTDMSTQSSRYTQNSRMSETERSEETEKPKYPKMGSLKKSNRIKTDRKK